MPQHFQGGIAPLLLHHSYSLLASCHLDDFSFLIMCKDRNDIVRNAVVSALRAIFDRTAQGSSFNKCFPSPLFIARRLHIVLKCYMVLNMVSDIETYYRENFIAPFLDSMITRVGALSPNEA